MPIAIDVHMCKNKFDLNFSLKLDTSLKSSVAHPGTILSGGTFVGYWLGVLSSQNSDVVGKASNPILWGGLQTGGMCLPLPVKVFSLCGRYG